MPLERFLHPRLRGSQKVGGLTDLEFRVWSEGYLLCADDYGVIEDEPYAVQSGSRALGARPARVISRCLARLVDVGLLVRFEVQGKPYLCQLDWQDWQRVRWPRQTARPIPPAEILARCSPATQALFRLHTLRNSSATVPDSVPEAVPHQSRSSSEIETRVRANGYGSSSEPEGGLGETSREARLWTAWRAAMQRATGLTLRLSPSANEFANLRKLCDLSDDDAALIAALERFAQFSPEELRTSGARQKSLGWVVALLPQLIATKPAVRVCSRRHDPPCPDEAACTRRYLAELREPSGAVR